MEIRNILKNTFTFLTLGIAAASCSDDMTDTEWWWGPVDDNDNELTEKPRYMWIDAGANFSRFSNSQ